MVLDSRGGASWDYPKEKLYRSLKNNILSPVFAAFASNFC